MKVQIRRFEIGDLVQIVHAPDQNNYTREFVGKVGMVIENVPTNSSPNIWKVLLLDNETIRLHALDIELLTEENVNGITR